jgi:hypothetical protein
MLITAIERLVAFNMTSHDDNDNNMYIIRVSTPTWHSTRLTRNVIGKQVHARSRRRDDDLQGRRPAQPGLEQQPRQWDIVVPDIYDACSNSACSFHAWR